MTADEIEKTIAEAEAALEGVTPGEWKAAYSKWEPDNFIVQTDHPCRRVLAQFDGDGDGPDDQSLADARFIAHARQAVPALIAALRAMQAETERLRGERDELVTAKTNWNMRANEAETRAEAAEAKLSEVEKERDEQVADLYDVIAMNNRTAAQLEATVATLTAQVEAMRGALEQIAGSDIQSFMIDARVGPHTVSHNRRYCDAPDVARLLKIARAALTTENQTNG